MPRKTRNINRVVCSICEEKGYENRSYHWESVRSHFERVHRDQVFLMRRKELWNYIHANVYEIDAAESPEQENQMIFVVHKFITCKVKDNTLHIYMKMINSETGEIDVKNIWRVYDQVPYTQRFQIFLSNTLSRASGEKKQLIKQVLREKVRFGFDGLAMEREKKAAEYCAKCAERMEIQDQGQIEEAEVEFFE